jgi:hypothetical protein
VQPPQGPKWGQRTGSVVVAWGSSCVARIPAI